MQLRAITPSYARLDRLPFLFSRWNGPISSVFCIDEEELKRIVIFIMKQSRQNILYTFYIRRLSPITPYLLWNGTKDEYPDGVYPLNVLRDIGIDSIATSHYLLLDIDVFPSSNMYLSILMNSHLLSGYTSALVFQLFQYNRNLTKGVKKLSIFHQMYDSMLKSRVRWNELPYTKSELLNGLAEDRIRLHFNYYQVRDTPSFRSRMLST